MAAKITPEAMIVWKDPECHDAERRFNLYILQALFGGGPFIVRETIPVPEADQREHGKQYLTLADANGEILSVGNEAARLSELWFRRVRILIYAPTRSKKGTPRKEDVA